MLFVCSILIVLYWPISIHQDSWLGPSWLTLTHGWAHGIVTYDWARINVTHDSAHNIGTYDWAGISVTHGLAYNIVTYHWAGIIVTHGSAYLIVGYGWAGTVMNHGWAYLNLYVCMSINMTGNIVSASLTFHTGWYNCHTKIYSLPIQHIQNTSSQH